MSAFKFYYLEVLVVDINRVFECDICKLIKIENYFYNDHDVNNREFSLDCFLHVRRRVDFIKKALVYYDKFHNCYIDIETRKKYSFGILGCVEGDHFIDTKKEVLYGSKLFDSKRKHYSKRKILKKYSEYKKGDNNECE